MNAVNFKTPIPIIEFDSNIFGFQRARERLKAREDEFDWCCFLLVQVLGLEISKTPPEF
jgi:hypothetical protein